jgi:hypothetical protein
MCPVRFVTHVPSRTVKLGRVCAVTQLRPRVLAADSSVRPTPRSNVAFHVADKPERLRPSPIPSRTRPSIVTERSCHPSILAIH